MNKSLYIIMDTLIPSFFQNCSIIQEEKVWREKVIQPSYYLKRYSI